MGKVRTWKKNKETRSSAMMPASNPSRNSWEKKVAMREQRVAVMAAQKEVDEEIRSTKKAGRERVEAKAKKKEENMAKGLQYQVIKNSKKIKKMSKKQMRYIKKADTSGVAPKIYGKEVSVG